MALTEKGRIAVNYIKEYYPTGKFTAKDLKELGVPVKYIGVGEGIDDLQKFDPQSYVNAIFDVTKEDEAQEEQEA